jgi:hypothetical protein
MLLLLLLLLLLWGARVCRQEAWDMFDFGYSSYMKHAFPKVRHQPWRR